MQLNLIKAIANVQAEAPVIKVDAKNPAFQGRKYATIKQIMDTIKPLLNKNNLVFTSRFDFQNEQWGMLSSLIWCGPHGEMEKESAFFPMEKIADPQQLGKLATYARRYNITSLLNLCFEDDDDDDDGNSFMAKKTPKTAPKPLNL